MGSIVWIEVCIIFNININIHVQRKNQYHDSQGVHLALLRYKFKSNTKVSRTAKCSSATICNYSEYHTNSYFWNHQLEPTKEQENGSSALPGSDIWFCSLKEGLDYVNLSLSFLRPKCFCCLYLPHSKAVPISDVSSGTVHKPGWTFVIQSFCQSFCPEVHGAREVQQCFSEVWGPVSLGECSSSGPIFRSVGCVVPAPSTYMLLNKHGYL